ncbi:MAG: hypothetical protein S4CHLAM102_15960 [Chlamydiia bacterium]|nr:hypothetical protein [Chlamydiia bacterium]
MGIEIKPYVFAENPILTEKEQNALKEATSEQGTTYLTTPALILPEEVKGLLVAEYGWTVDILEKPPADKEYPLVTALTESDYLITHSAHLRFQKMPSFKLEDLESGDGTERVTLYLLDDMCAPFFGGVPLINCLFEPATEVDELEYGRDDKAVIFKITMPKALLQTRP